VRWTCFGKVEIPLRDEELDNRATTVYQGIAEETVRLVQTSRRTQREIAGDLGVGLSSCSARSGGAGIGAVDPSAAESDVTVELKQLRRQIDPPLLGQHNRDRRWWAGALMLLSFLKLAAARTTALPIAFLGAALTIFPSNLGHADRPSAAISSIPAAPGATLAADSNECDAQPVGTVTVATLSNAPIVTLLANGHPVVLLLDTGAERTVLTPTVAERIGAQPPRIEFPQGIRGIAGSLSSREVELRSLVASGVSMPWRRVVVAQVTMAKIFGAPLDGLLGADVLSGFDIDLDLPHQRMVLYERRSCPNGPPWAGPYAAISTGRSRGEHLFFPVQLDGHGITAIVDTGAQLTTLSTTIAVALGVTEAALARDRSIMTQGATAERLNSHIHQFLQLKVGTEIISKPEFVVADIKLKDADIALGADFLKSRRIWLSYGSLQIFLSRW
jgi:predicted aspartyl protease